MCKPKVPLLFITVLIFGTVFNTFGQDKIKRLPDMILKRGLKDSLFIFDFSKNDDRNETQLKYLGTLKSNDGKAFKILNYCWLWGRSPRATNRVLIYNDNNRYLGCYMLEMKGELPLKIDLNELVFSVQTEDKLKSQTRISFANGIPSQIEIGGGNLYHLVINRAN